jgi:hypothetical protein
VNPPNMGNRHGNMLYLLMALWTAKSIDYSIWYPYDMIIYYPIVRPIFVEVTSPHGPSTLDTFSRVNRVHTADTAFWISFPLPCNGIRTRLKFRSLGHCSWWYSSFSRNKLEGERTEMVIFHSYVNVYQRVIKNHTKMNSACTVPFVRRWYLPCLQFSITIHKSWKHIK